MRNYKILKNQVFTKDNLKLVPLRHEDRYKIMDWRNEQMYHLRQAEPLTKVKQDAYFENVVAKLFDQEQPSQILFSFLKGDECIGYGGLVHINWIDKNAEISFVIETKLEKEHLQAYWRIFLSLLENVAFKEIQLHKIFTFAFDIRPLLYETLENSDFVKECVLKEHCHFNEKFLDVVIHAKLNKN